LHGLDCRELELLASSGKSMPCSCGCPETPLFPDVHSLSRSPGGGICRCPERSEGSGAHTAGRASRSYSRPTRVSGGGGGQLVNR